MSDAGNAEIVRDALRWASRFRINTYAVEALDRLLAERDEALASAESNHEASMRWATKLTEAEMERDDARGTYRELLAEVARLTAALREIEGLFPGHAVCIAAAALASVGETDGKCHCGYLGWTVEKHGRLTHKHACPARTDGWCQSHPGGCPVASVGETE